MATALLSRERHSEHRGDLAETEDRAF